ncbi:GNAT family N-acetyltransferase [Dictyobacter vulcani]|nr:GNAT family N-acetyltransferase [Dictyobacter vulcani]
MRIRHFRAGDITSIAAIQQVAAEFDQRPTQTKEEFMDWFLAPANDVLANAFVMTDDDDELLTWGQAGTLEGIEGEIVAYTLLQYSQDSDGYHLRCLGAVHPEHRHRGAGRALLVGALNRARVLALDFEFEAEAEGIPVYFEVLLPLADAGALQLANKFDLQAVNQSNIYGMQLYRAVLWE